MFFWKLFWKLEALILCIESTKTNSVIDINSPKGYFAKIWNKCFSNSVINMLANIRAKGDPIARTRKQ